MEPAPVPLKNDAHRTPGNLPFHIYSFKYAFNYHHHTDIHVTTYLGDTVETACHKMWSCVVDLLLVSMKTLKLSQLLETQFEELLLKRWTVFAGKDKVFCLVGQRKVELSQELNYLALTKLVLLRGRVESDRQTDLCNVHNVLYRHELLSFCFCFSCV